MSPMQESKIMTAAQCAALMVPAMAARKRMLITSRRGKLGRFFKIFAPGTDRPHRRQGHRRAEMTRGHGRRAAGTRRANQTSSRNQSKKRLISKT
jgi:hypothetical protein